MEIAADQGKYQVRFEWGTAGAAATQSGADAVIWVDQLATGDTERPLPEPDGALVLATVQNAKAVADWVLARQHERGGRFMVTVIAAGDSRADGADRFAVEDLLAAGAVIDALTEVGLDHCSPEAAAASAAYSGLTQALKHLIKNSVSGVQAGLTALDLSPTDVVTVLKEPAPAA
ncbi:MAG: 2-phosphosulfolactate phosphatase [Microbacteriaceae bacterium]